MPFRSRNGCSVKSSYGLHTSSEAAVMKHEISHRISESDHEFLTAFEAGAIAPANFNHRAHVRLAYIYLATNDVERGTTLMRHAIVNFLRHHGIAPTKYH